MPKKGSKKYIFVLNKYQIVTCFYMHFIELFKNIVFRSVALVTKKVMGYLNFFHRPHVFCRHVPYPINKKNIFV